MPAAGVVPQQAVPRCGTFVRAGALVWGGTQAAPDGAYSSCQQVEQLVADAGQDAGRIDDLLDELTRARLWVPLPAGGPVTDGSAVALPTGHLPGRRIRAVLHLGPAPRPLGQSAGSRLFALAARG